MSDRPHPIGEPPDDHPAPDPDDEDEDEDEDDGPLHPGPRHALSRHAVTTPVGQIATLLIEHVRTLVETSLNDPGARAASAVALAQREAMTVLELYARARPDEPATPLAVGTLLGCGMDLALKKVGGYSNELLAATKRITMAVDAHLRPGRGGAVMNALARTASHSAG